MILIIGAKGSMGKRYQAILKYLGKQFVCVDSNAEFDNAINENNFSAYIITTPTDTHYSYIHFLATHWEQWESKPILCEKPLTTSLTKLHSMYSLCDDSKIPLTMMNQYAMLPDLSNEDGLTSYDFYNTGKDGLIWDCIQVIGLANGDIKLRNNSPVWKCNINGWPVSIADMDRAYVKFVDQWLKRPDFQDRKSVIDAHVKTRKVLENHESRINSDPGA